MGIQISLESLWRKLLSAQADRRRSPQHATSMVCLLACLSVLLFVAPAFAQDEAAPTATPKAAPATTPTPQNDGDCPPGSPCAEAVDPSPLPAGAPSPPPEAAPQPLEDPNRVEPLPPLPTISPRPAAPPDVVSETPTGREIVPAPTPNPNETTPNNTTPGEVAPGETVPGATPPIEGATSEGDSASTEVITDAEPPGGAFVLDSPNGVIYDQGRGLALARGDVTFTYREFTVRAERGLVDYNTNTATLAGNLTVEVRGRTFFGRSLRFDLDSGRWTLSQIETTFPPELFPPGTVASPIYLRGGSVTGQGDDVRGENIKFSSCERDQYYVISRRVEFYRQPNGEPERIVLRRNELYLFGAKILALPVYVISLVGQRSRRVPGQTTFGQNPIDGFFTRTVFDLRADRRLTDSVLLDLLQKRGVGVGLQREWASGGLLYLYAVSGRGIGGLPFSPDDGSGNAREINARVDRSFQLAPSVDGNFRFNLTRNSSQTGGGIDTRDGTLSLVRTGDRSTTNAFASFNSSTFGEASSSQNRSLRVEHRHDFGQNFTLQTDLAFNRASFGESFESGTNDANLRLSKTARPFDLFLRTELHNDIVQDRTYQLERLPEVLLQSSTDRLGFAPLQRILPGTFSLSLGRFNEPRFGQGGANTTQENRVNFFFNARERNFDLVGTRESRTNLGVRVGGSFEQAIYRSDAARYSLSYNGGLDGRLGPFGARLNYFKFDTFGFTPFLFDFRSPSEFYDYTLFFEPNDELRINVSGGRDILNDFTRDVLARLQWAPNANFYTSLGTSYDPRDGNVGDVYGNIRFNRPRGRFLGGRYALGFRYSPDGRGLTRANASFDVDFDSKTRFQALLGYNGTSDSFDFEQYRVVRDIGCFNVFATYDGSRNELRFDLALKAFPFADTRFGRNQFSEGFDAAVGEVR